MGRPAEQSLAHSVDRLGEEARLHPHLTRITMCAGTNDRNNCFGNCLAASFLFMSVSIRWAQVSPRVERRVRHTTSRDDVRVGRLVGWHEDDYIKTF